MLGLRRRIGPKSSATVSLDWSELLLFESASPHPLLPMHWTPSVLAVVLPASRSMSSHALTRLCPCCVVLSRW